MRFVQKSLIVALGATLGMTLVAAASAADKRSLVGSTDSASTRTTEENSIVLANQILDRWQPVAQQLGVGSSAWREMFFTQLSMMDAGTLKRIDAAKVSATSDAKANYAQFAQAVRNGIMQSYVLAKSGKGNMKLASLTNDQVFVPITPCRVVDSRNPGGGGPISFGTQRTFYFYTDNGTFSWASQGGKAGSSGTSCPGTVNPGVTGGNDGAPSAAAATVTAVSPTAAGNFIVWGGQGTPPPSSVINFAAGQTLANTTVIPWGGRTGGTLDFMVRYNGPSGQADVVVDVVGYFVENHATAVECFDTGASNSIAAASDGTVDAPFCTTGYQMTGGECNADNGFVNEVASWAPSSFSGGHWQCKYHNWDGSASHSISAWTACCRVPGQ